MGAPRIEAARSDGYASADDVVGEYTWILTGGVAGDTASADTSDTF